MAGFLWTSEESWAPKKSFCFSSNSFLAGQNWNIKGLDGRFTQRRSEAGTILHVYVCVCVSETLYPPSNRQNTGYFSCSTGGELQMSARGTVMDELVTRWSVCLDVLWVVIEQKYGPSEGPWELAMALVYMLPFFSCSQIWVQFEDRRRSLFYWRLTR